MRTSKAVRQVIHACIDDQRMLEHESRFVHGHRRELLERLASDEAQFVGKLRAFGVGRNGDTLSRTGSWSSIAREIGRSLRVALGGPSNGDSVSACRRSCVRTEARLDEVLDLPWPEAIRSALVEQRAHLETAREALTAVQY